MKRLLLVEIDSEETECGACNGIDDAEMCVYFDQNQDLAGTNFDGSNRYLRVPQCLEAERAAKGPLSDRSQALVDLLRRIIKYAREDEMQTREATRLARALEQAKKLIKSEAATKGEG